MTETPQQERDGLRAENLRDYTRLRRSTTDRKIAGVAGGLGRHLDVDPTILRVLFVVLCFFGGAGFVLYGVAWLLVPVEGSERAVVRTSPSTRSALLIAAAVVAALILLSNSFQHFWFPWPLAVIALVLFVILMNRDKPMTGSSAPPPPPGGSAAPAAGEGTTTTLPPYDGPGYGAVPPAWTPPPPEQSAEPERPRPDRGPLLFGFTLALLAVALGSLGLYDTTGGHVVPAAYAALALAVVGAMLVVGAWVGRAGGLIALGLAATLALGATSVAHGGFGDARRVDYSPVTASLVRDSYTQPTGQIVLDLRDVRDPAALDGRTITVSQDVGEILVVLPPDVGADISAYVRGPGAVDLPGNHRGGIDTRATQDVSASGETAHVHLNLDLSVGHIEVRQ